MSPYPHALTKCQNIAQTIISGTEIRTDVYGRVKHLEDVGAQLKTSPLHTVCATCTHVTLRVGTSLLHRA